jgi:hypothetical protein
LIKTQYSSIRLAPRLENLSILEQFIGQCRFLDSSLRCRAILVATEYFDNIIAHSRCCGCCKVYIALYQSRDTELVLRYRTRNFQEMVQASRVTQPYYDAASERYRGLGLLMCKNLSSSIVYKRGLLRSSVVIIL